jgi:hypothetical protein
MGRRSCLATRDGDVAPDNDLGLLNTNATLEAANGRPFEIRELGSGKKIELRGGTQPTDPTGVQGNSSLHIVLTRV